MAKKITEQEAIQFFIERKEALLKELNKVQAALEVLTAEEKASDFKSGRKAAAAPKAGRPRQKRASRKGGMEEAASASQPLTPRPEFSAEGSWDEKISYALSQIGSGYKEDVIQLLQEKQPDIDQDKLQRAVAFRLSLLLKNNKIKGVKEGKRYKYSLVEA